MHYDRCQFKINLQTKIYKLCIEMELGLETDGHLPEINVLVCCYAQERNMPI